MLPYVLGAVRGLWPGPVLFVVLMADAAVGLIWWSCLARRKAAMAAVFE